MANHLVHLVPVRAAVGSMGMVYCEGLPRRGFVRGMDPASRGTGLGAANGPYTDRWCFTCLVTKLHQ